MEKGQRSFATLSLKDRQVFFLAPFYVDFIKTVSFEIPDYKYCIYSKASLDFFYLDGYLTSFKYYNNKFHVRVCICTHIYTYLKHHFILYHAIFDHTLIYNFNVVFIIAFDGLEKFSI